MVLRADADSSCRSLFFYGVPMNDVEAHELVTATARSARAAQRSLARAPRAVKDAAHIWRPAA